MLSNRVLRQSLPRASRSITTSARIAPRHFRPSSSIQSHLKPTSWRPQALFSTSARRLESEGQVNAELSAKLESELSIEKEMRDQDQPPDHIREYLENTEFKLQDTPGQEEVVLTRTFGDEKIRVTFSVDDLNNSEDDPDQMNDPAMQEEMDDIPTDTQSGGANTKGAVNQGKTSGGNFRVAPEDQVAPSDREGEEGEMEESGNEPSWPAHISVVVERPGKGAMQLETVAQDGLIAIDSVYYYSDAKHVDPKSSQDEQAASRLYTGPPFGNLDEDLQVLFEKFLDERGINTTMALFVPEYIDYKEQKEYLNWLANVKKFVD